jgi:hypothetical protein
MELNDSLRPNGAGIILGIFEAGFRLQRRVTEDWVRIVLCVATATRSGFGPFAFISKGPVTAQLEKLQGTR